MADLMNAETPMSAANAVIPASIEVSPKHILDKDEYVGLFPKGTRTYVTDIGTHSHEDLARVSRKLRDAGYRPVQHIGARRLKSEEEFDAHVKRLTEEGGLDDVLIIAGEADRQMGPYSASIELLRTGILDKYGIKAIGVAGHPEGNPSAPEGEIYNILREKAEFQRETDAEMRIVTQFGFDGDAFANWAWHVKAMGIELPIHLGVAGPAKITTLIKFAAMSGVGNSLKFLKKRAGALTALATSHSPEPVVEPIETFWQENSDGPVAQIHVFPFGGLKKSSEWLVERGSWDINISLYDDASVTNGA
ncbi:MAG: methylenetetrahydrofolate reductase [Pseudomonadota bacterium]